MNIESLREIIEAVMVRDRSSEPTFAVLCFNAQSGLNLCGKARTLLRSVNFDSDAYEVVEQTPGLVLKNGGVLIFIDKVPENAEPYEHVWLDDRVADVVARADAALKNVGKKKAEKRQTKTQGDEGKTKFAKAEGEAVGASTT